MIVMAGLQCRGFMGKKGPRHKIGALAAPLHDGRGSRRAFGAAQARKTMNDHLPWELSARNLSASIAAMQPVPAAVTACR